jgi:hypothetical protein
MTIMHSPRAPGTPAYYLGRTAAAWHAGLWRPRPTAPNAEQGALVRPPGRIGAAT